MHLSEIPPRFQRLLLKMQPDDFVIEYFPGTRIPMADDLSRASPQEKGEIKGLYVTVHEPAPHLTRLCVQ